MSKQLLRLLATMCAFAMLAAACGGSDSSDGAAEDATTTTAEAETTEADDEPDTDDAAADESDADDEPVEETPADDEVEEDPAEPAEEETLDATGFDAVTITVEEFVEERGLNGASVIVVHKDDGVVYEEYFGEFEPGRISLIASSSKMISAGVLLRLQEDGLLDLNAPVAAQVDWATGNPDIVPAQLISNSSGLVGLGPNLLYAPYVCQWSPEGTITDCATQIFTTADDDGDQVDPDSEFRYGGAQWQVAGAVAESVSGKSWDELINEIYIEPCGVDSLGYISLGSVFTGAPGYPTVFAGDPDGVAETANPNIEGGGYVSMTDYAQLMLMHLRGGTCGDNQVLSQESLDTMHADRVSAVYDGNAGGPGFGYGMGWWVDRETGRISDGGAFGTVPWLDLDDGYGAYIVIEDESDTGQALKTEIEELVHEAVVNR